MDTLPLEHKISKAVILLVVPNSIILPLDSPTANHCSSINLTPVYHISQTQLGLPVRFVGNQATKPLIASTG